MNDVIDLATINFGRSGGGTGPRDPDYNIDYSSSDFRAPTADED